MSFAAIFVPDFPVEAVVRAAPDLREQAVAIVEGTPPLLRVAAANERARQAGVEIGITRLEAESRLSASGLEWTLRRRSPVQEQAAHAALVDCACAFSPRVEDNPAAPATVVLDLSGLERLFGPPAKIARDLARRASELGLEVNVSVAGNPEAAIHAARGFPGITIIAAGKEGERLGSLPMEVLLGALPLAKGAEDPVEILNTLDRWGIRTFRALAALPVTAVKQRLGETGVRLQILARGEGRRPLVPASPPLTFTEAMELEYPVALLEPLAFVLTRMLEQLCARLSARALATQELNLHLELAAGEDDENPARPDNFAGKSSPDGTGHRSGATPQAGIDAASAAGGREHHLTIRLPVPMVDAQVFLKLLQLELRARPPLAPVEKIFLSAEPVEPRYTQGGLFLPTAPEPAKLEITLARIKAVVGQTSGASSERVAGGGWPRAAAAILDQPYPNSGAADPPTGQELRVGAAELIDSHRPDAFRIKPFAPPDAGTAPPSKPAKVSGERTPGQRGRTALRRFRPPVPVEVEVRHGRPVSIGDFQLLLTGSSSARAAPSPVSNSEPRRAGILWATGPWRESGEWWTDRTWSREVWDVALQGDGLSGLYRMYRDTITGKWFVEASYD